MHVLIAIDHIGGETHADSADKKGLSDGPPDHPPDDHPARTRNEE
jgi:hypothetical protein